MDVLAQEGDEDAALVSDFESAAADLLQSDDELASAYTAYTEARRRLNEKVRSRGFWPLQSKGKFKGSSKGVKGKFNKGHSSSRKSLQQRILESRCRLCGKMGHWKAECPSKSDAAGSAPNRSPQAPTSFAQGISMEAAVDDLNALPLEFLNLPMSEQVTLDASQHDMNQYVFAVAVEDNPKRKLSQTLNQWKSHKPPSATVPGMMMRCTKPENASEIAWLNTEPHRLSLMSRHVKLRLYALPPMVATE